MKTIIKAYLFFLMGILLAGCDVTSGTLNEVYKYPKEQWGEWVRMDTGNTWYITSNHLKSGDSIPYNAAISITQQSANVIKVTETGSSANEYYLYASRIANGSFSGLIVGERGRSAGGRAMAPLDEIDVKVTNLNDNANEVNTRTDANGILKVEGVIPGDVYEITADGISTQVMANTDGEDVGDIALRNGINFSASIKPKGEGSYYGPEHDMTQLYTGPGNKYNFVIDIKNTGQVTSVASSYRLTLPNDVFFDTIQIDNKAATTELADMLGTYLSGQSGALNIMGLGCSSVKDEYEYRKIKIEIQDHVNGTMWDETVSLKFNREQVSIYVKSDDVVNGMVIVPTGKAYQFKTEKPYGAQYYTSEIKVPKYTKDYLIAFSGATVGKEAKYTFAIGRQPASPLSGIIPPILGIGTEEAAKVIQPNEQPESYLYYNVAQFFKVNIGRDNGNNNNNNNNGLPDWVTGTPVQLTSGQWVNGSLASTADEDWYSIPVSAGTAYRIWWNDIDQGDGTKTGDVVVGARYADGTIWIFGGTDNTADSGWNTPQSFTANQNGTVYIRVMPYYRSSNYTGIYGIAYSTDSTRPGTD